MVVASFTPSYTTLNRIYIRNSLSFNFSSKNRLINSSLILAAPTLLIFSLSILLLSINQLTISYNYLTVTSYKLVSLILVLPLIPKVVAAVNGVVTSAFSSILFDFINTITLTVNI